METVTSKIKPNLQYNLSIAITQTPTRTTNSSNSSPLSVLYPINTRLVSILPPPHCSRTLPNAVLIPLLSPNHSSPKQFPNHLLASTHMSCSPNHLSIPPTKIRVSQCFSFEMNLIFFLALNVVYYTFIWHLICSISHSHSRL